MPDFVQQVREAMECYFGDDTRRISHALQVASYAQEMLAFIDADPTVTLAAAYLHDIGIPTAERKFGSCPGFLQEQEGPPVARALLTELGGTEPLIETVCAIVGRHHTPAGIDSPEFRILWDADALVNLAEVVPGKTTEQIQAILNKSLVTEPGYRRAISLFLNPSEALPPDLETGFSTSFDLIVRYAETDAQGVVHHANYLVWFEEGRSDHLRQRGLRYSEMEESGLFVIVAEAEVRYKAPAFYEDRITIQTTLIRARGKILEFTYRALAAGRTLAEGRTRHLVLGADRRSVSLPSEILTKLHKGTAVG